MQNCSLSNNQAIGGVGGGGQFSGPGQPGQGYGGGLFDNGGTTLLEEVTFVGNVADTDGDDSYTSTQ